MAFFDEKDIITTEETALDTKPFFDPQDIVQSAEDKLTQGIQPKPISFTTQTATALSSFWEPEDIIAPSPGDTVLGDMSMAAKSIGMGLYSAAFDMFPKVLAEAIRGGDIDVDTTDTVLDRWIEEQKRDLQRWELSETEKNRRLFGIIKAGDVLAGLQNLGYSWGVGLAGMLPGSKVGAAIGTAVGPAGTAIGGVIGGMLGAALTTAPVMYRATKDQFLSDQLDKALRENPDLTQEQWAEMKAALERDAQLYAFWEAAPETVGNMISAAIIKIPAGKILTRIPDIKNAIGRTLVKAGVKVALDVPEELATETWTQHEQGAIEARTGMREKAPTWSESYHEVSAQVLVTTLAGLSMGHAAVRVGEIRQERAFYTALDKAGVMPSERRAIKARFGSDNRSMQLATERPELVKLALKSDVLPSVAQDMKDSLTPSLILKTYIEGSGDGKDTAAGRNAVDDLLKSKDYKDGQTRLRQILLDNLKKRKHDQKSQRRMEGLQRKGQEPGRPVPQPSKGREAAETGRVAQAPPPVGEPTREELSERAGFVPMGSELDVPGVAIGDKLSNWLDENYELSPQERTEAIQRLPEDLSKIKQAIADIDTISKKRAERIKNRPDNATLREQPEIYQEWQEKYDTEFLKEEEQLKTIESRFSKDVNFKAESSGSTVESESIYINAELPVINDTLFNKYRISQHGITEELPDIFKLTLPPPSAPSQKAQQLEMAKGVTAPIVASAREAGVPLEEEARATEARGQKAIEPVALFQWQASIPRKQRHGAQTEIRALTEDIYQQYVRPLVGNRTAETAKDFMAKFPGNDHVALTRPAGDNWYMTGLGTAQTLQDQLTKTKIAKPVTDFFSPEAIAWATRRTPKTIDMEPKGIPIAIPEEQAAKSIRGTNPFSTPLMSPTEDGVAMSLPERGLVKNYKGVIMAQKRQGSGEDTLTRLFAWTRNQWQFQAMKEGRPFSQAEILKYAYAFADLHPEAVTRRQPKTMEAEQQVTPIIKTGAERMPKGMGNPAKDMATVVDKEFEKKPIFKIMRKIRQVIPLFQGNKREMSDPVGKAIETEFTPEERNMITQINGYFAGGGSWELYLALTHFRNVNRIKLNEIDPDRSFMLELMHTKGNKIRELYASTGAQDVIEQEWRRMTAMGQGASGGGLTARLNSWLNEHMATPENRNQRAIIKIFADLVPRTMLRGKNTLQELTWRVMEQVNNSYKGAEQFRRGGGAIEYTTGDSYAMTPEQGRHILDTMDPPYVFTTGYGGHGLVGTDIYEQTLALNEKLINAGNSVLYTDSAWWIPSLTKNKEMMTEEQMKKKVSPSEKQKATDILDKQYKAFERFKSIEKPISRRWETLGLHNGVRGQAPAEAKPAAPAIPTKTQAEQAKELPYRVGDKVQYRKSENFRKYHKGTVTAIAPMPDKILVTIRPWAANAPVETLDASLVIQTKATQAKRTREKQLSELAALSPAKRKQAKKDSKAFDDLLRTTPLFDDLTAGQPGTEQEMAVNDYNALRDARDEFVRAIDAPDADMGSIAQRAAMLPRLKAWLAGEGAELMGQAQRDMEEYDKERMGEAAPAPAVEEPTVSEDLPFSIGKATGHWSEVHRIEKVVENKGIRVNKGIKEGKEIYETQVKTDGKWNTVQYSSTLEEAKEIHEWNPPRFDARHHLDRARNSLWYARALQRGLSPTEIFGHDPAITRLIESGAPTNPTTEPQPDIPFSVSSVKPWPVSETLPSTRLSRIITELNNLIDTSKIKVVQTLDQLPPDIKARVDATMRMKGYEASQIRGFVADRIRYIIEANMPHDETEARAVIMEEVLHPVINSVLAEYGQNIFTQTLRSGHAVRLKLRQIVGSYGRQWLQDNGFDPDNAKSLTEGVKAYMDDSGRRVGAYRELIAQMWDERAVRPKVWERLLAAIRHYLRKAGYVKTMTDADMDFIIDRAIGKLAHEREMEALQGEGGYSVLSAGQPMFAIAERKALIKRPEQAGIRYITKPEAIQFSIAPEEKRDKIVSVGANNFLELKNASELQTKPPVGTDWRIYSLNPKQVIQRLGLTPEDADRHIILSDDGLFISKNAIVAHGDYGMKTENKFGKNSLVGGTTFYRAPSGAIRMDITQVASVSSDELVNYFIQKEKVKGAIVDPNSVKVSVHDDTSDSARKEIIAAGFKLKHKTQAEAKLATAGIWAGIEGKLTTEREKRSGAQREDETVPRPLAPPVSRKHLFAEHKGKEIFAPFRVYSDGYGYADDMSGPGDIESVLRKRDDVVVHYVAPAIAEGEFAGSVTGGNIEEISYTAKGIHRYLYLATFTNVDTWAQEWWTSPIRLTANVAIEAIESARIQLRFIGKPTKPIEPIQFSLTPRITPEQDAAYLDAVKRGDMGTAQRMVNEAAKKILLTPQTINKAIYSAPFIDWFGEWQTKGMERAYEKAIQRQYEHESGFVGDIEPSDVPLTFRITKYIGEHKKFHENSPNEITETLGGGVTRYWIREGRDHQSWIERRFVAGRNTFEQELLDAKLDIQIHTPRQKRFGTEALHVRASGLGLITPAQMKMRGWIGPIQGFKANRQQYDTTEPWLGIQAAINDPDFVWTSAARWVQHDKNLGSFTSVTRKATEPRPLVERVAQRLNDDLRPKILEDGTVENWEGERRNIRSFLVSADTVTRDDAGNVIPLSQRFTPTKEDIQFSLTPRKSGRQPRAIPAIAPQVREKLMRLEQMDAEENNIIPDRIAQDRANELIHKRGGTEVVLKELSGGNLGGIPVNQRKDVQTWAGKEIFGSKSVFDRIANGSEAGIRLVAGAFRNYLRLGSDIARALRARRDPVNTPVQRRSDLIALLTKPPEGWLAKLDAMTPDQRQAAENQQNKEIQERIAKLHANGIALDRITDEQLMNDVEFAILVNNVSALHSSRGERVYEYWRNSILSGFQTNVVNFTGNFMFGAWEVFPQRFSEALANQFVKDSDAPTMASIKAAWRAILPSITLANINFVKTWTTEMQITSKIEASDRGVKIPGKTGRIIRIPQRLMCAVDEWFKTVLAGSLSYDYAIRSADKHELTGRDREWWIQNSVTNLDSVANKLAHDEALRMTWQNQLGAVGQKLITMRGDKGALGWLFKFMFPFVTTPTNIIKTGLWHKSPLGIFRMLTNLAKGQYKKPETGKWKSAEIITDATEQFFAWTLVGALWALTAPPGDDDDDQLPFLTGSRSAKQGKRNFEWRHMPPQSIRIGNKWYSYSRIEPIATALSTTIDLMNAMRAGAAGKEMWPDVKKAFLANFQDKTFLQGMGDLISLVEGNEYAFRKMCQNFVGSWIPNVIRQPFREMDEYIRDVKVREKGLRGAGETFIGRPIQQALPISSLQPMPKYDYWGQPISKDAFASPMSDIIYRIFVPARVQTATSTTNLDRLIFNFNRRQTRREDEWWPGQPRDTFTIRGQKYRMTDEQYEQYLKLRGRLAFEIARHQRWNFDRPTRYDIKRLRSIFNRAGNVARRRAMMMLSKKT